MQIDILTLFPDMYRGPFDESIVARARQTGKVHINIHNLRDYTADKHRIVDDRPYGGGPGMILKVDVIDRALTDLKQSNSKVVLLSAKGKLFTQQVAQKLAQDPHLIFISGHYEGVDQRVSDHLVDLEIRIGDYVLTGGELPSMVVIDSLVRILPGVLGNQDSPKEESHSRPGFMEYPQYTRPESYRGWSVPEVLLSGHHQQISNWQKTQTRNTSTNDD